MSPVACNTTRDQVTLRGSVAWLLEKVAGEDHIGGELYHAFPITSLSDCCIQFSTKLRYGRLNPGQCAGALCTNFPRQARTRRSVLPTATWLLRANLARCTTVFCARVWLLDTGNSVVDRSVVECATVVVAFGNLAERSFMQIAKARSWTGAIVYFDVVTAFAAMIRAFVCHQEPQDHLAATALVAVGFTLEEVDAIASEAQKAPASDDMLRSTRLRRLLAHALSNTWAATQGVYEVIEDLKLANHWLAWPSECSCAGFQHVEHAGVARLPVAGDSPVAPSGAKTFEMVSVHDTSYVDDASAYIWDSDGEIAVRKVTTTVATNHETFPRHGIQLNYAAGKSGCLITLRGANTNNVRHSLGGSNIARLCSCSMDSHHVCR